jgi:hypothetical protein
LIAPAAPRTLATHHHDKGFPIMPEQTVRPPITLNIRYTDAFNQDTERLITINRVEVVKNRPRAVMGYCHTREDDRTFIIDRIETAFSDDGEIIPIEDLTAALMAPKAPRPDAMQRSDPNALRRPRRPSQPERKPHRILRALQIFCYVVTVLVCALIVLAILLPET